MEEHHPLSGDAVLGHGHGAGGVLVEAANEVDRRAGFGEGEAGGEGIGEGVGQMSLRGMADLAGGLIQNDEVPVLPEDRNGQQVIEKVRAPVHRVVQEDGDQVARADGPGDLGARAVYEDALRVVLQGTQFGARDSGDPS